MNSISRIVVTDKNIDADGAVDAQQITLALALPDFALRSSETTLVSKRESLRRETRRNGIWQATQTPMQSKTLSMH